MNEFQILVRHEHDYNTFSQALNIISDAINSGHTELLNLEISKRKCDELFNYLTVLNKYKLLQNRSNNLIWFNNQGFHINDHEFKSLDDVEKALNNIIFL